MGRAPCCDKANVKKGPWSPEEDAKLKEYIEKNGTGGNWIALPHKADLRRCGKSCRLRWLNYLRPNIKHGEFSDDEDRIIYSLFASIGSRWSIIAAQLPGRTDNDIKNYWNTKLKKKLFGLAAPVPHQHQKLRPHNQATINTPFSSNNSLILQNPSMESPYSSLQSSSAYECGNYSTPVVKAFSRGFEAISPCFTTVISSNSAIPSVNQAQEVIGYVNLMQGDNYNKFKGRNNDNISSNLLMFGGEASCSSSDGSSSGEHVIGLQSYFSNGIDENQKFLINNCADREKEDQNGCFSENPMDYSIEEIKQLISTSNICNNNLNFFVDEIIKTEEKSALYY